MADNILKGIIKIEAPGIQQVTNQVSSTMEATAIKVSRSADKIEQAGIKIADSFKNTGSQLSLLQKQTLAFGGGVNKFVSTFSKIPDVVDRAATSLRKVPNASNQATLALTNVGRVAQDLPFGFLGIANNLNPLLESFQRLRATTGSTGAALRALGSSLTGAGGIGLAISVVSSLLIVFGDRLFGSKKKVDEHKAALEAFNAELAASKKRVDELGDSLQFLSQLSTLNIKISGLSEVTDLQGQFVANQGEMVKATEEIKKAQQLQSQAFAIFQKKNTEENKKALDDANSNLAAAFKKEADLRNDGRVIARRIELQKVEDQKEALKKQQEALERHNQETKRIAKEIQELLQIPARVRFTNLDTADEELQKAKATVQGFLDGTIFKLKIQPIVSFSEPDILEPISVLTSDVLRLYNRVGGVLGKEVMEGFNEAVTTSGGTDSATTFLAQNLEQMFAKQFESFGLKFFLTADIDFDKSFEQNAENIKRQLAEIEKGFISAQISSDLATTSFNAAFDALLNGQNALQAIGQALKQLVVDLIKATVQTLIFKAVTNLFLPGSSLAGGAASGAAGIGRLLGGVASLGRVNPGGSNLGGISSFGRGNVVFRIGQNELVGILSQANATNGRSFTG